MIFAVRCNKLTLLHYTHNDVIDDVIDTHNDVIDAVTEYPSPPRPPPTIFVPPFVTRDIQGHKLPPALQMCVSKPMCFI